MGHRLARKLPGVLGVDVCGTTETSDEPSSGSRPAPAESLTTPHAEPRDWPDFSRPLGTDDRWDLSNINLIAPASFLSLVVPLAVFFAFQRYFAHGLLAGSVT